MSIFTETENVPVSALRLDTNKTVRDVILFPCVDWHFRFQRPQHLSRQLARNGCRVFYISTTPMLTDGNSMHLVSEMPEDNVFLVKLDGGGFVMADFFTDEMGDRVVDTYSKSVSALIVDLKLNNPTIIYQHPYWHKLAAKLSSCLQVYDCLDYFAGFKAGQESQSWIASSLSLKRSMWL